MGNAGRVLMIPKGDYNAATTYEMLDCVYYNGRSYVCKQTSTGNAPTNTTYWQVMTPDASAEIQALTNYVTKTGVKNVFSVQFTPATKNGVTATVNADGTISFSGTATADTYFLTSTFTLDTGRYMLSGCPSGGASNKYRLYLEITGGSLAATDYGSGTDFNLNEATEIKGVILINSGQSAAGLIYKPMITGIDVPDSDYAHYQPYAKTNAELTQDVTVKNVTLENVATNNGTAIIQYTQIGKHVDMTISFVPANEWAVGSGGRISFNLPSGVPLPTFNTSGVGLNVVTAIITYQGTVMAQNNFGSAISASSAQSVSFSYCAA